MFTLEGRSAIITESGGIGAAVATAYAGAGAAVLVTDIDADSAARVAKQIVADGGTAEYRPSDVLEDDRRRLRSCRRHPPGRHIHGEPGGAAVPADRRHRPDHQCHIGGGDIGDHRPGQLRGGEGRDHRAHQSLAKELARKQITVNAVAPLAATAMTENIRGNEKLAEITLARIPLGRWAEPEEIAGTFLFFWAGTHGHGDSDAALGYTNSTNLEYR